MRFSHLLLVAGVAAPAAPGLAESINDIGIRLGIRF